MQVRIFIPVFQDDIPTQSKLKLAKLGNKRQKPGQKER